MSTPISNSPQNISQQFRTQENREAMNKSATDEQVKNDEQLKVEDQRKTEDLRRADDRKAVDGNTAQALDDVSINSDIEKALASAGFDQEKIESIKSAIEQGNYPLDNRKIAESFIPLEKLL